MPGVLTGLVKGMEANRAYDLEQQRMGLDKQRLGVEQQRENLYQQQTDRENRRQDLNDQLQGNSAQIGDIMNAAAPDRAVLSATPQPPSGTRPLDPALAQKYDDQVKAHQDYTNSDSYKSAIENINGHMDKFREAVGKHNALLGKQAGEYSAEVNDELPRTEYNLRTSGLDGVSKRQFANYMIGKHKLPVEGWLKDPKTGTSPYDQAAGQLYDAMQTGNWDGKEQALSLLMPELHLALGQDLPNGNQVVGNQASHIFMDPKDPGFIHVTQAIAHDGPAGPGMSMTPHMDPGGMKIPVAVMGKRAKDFFDGVELMHQPQAQDKLGRAVEEGDSALHEFMRVAGAAGVPPALPVLKEIPAGGSLASVNQQTGETKIVASGQARVPAGRMAILQSMVDSGDAGSIAEANAIYDSQQRLGKNPPADGGAARETLVDQRRQRAADLAHRGAVLQLAREKGYVVDKDGNVRYSADDKSDPKNPRFKKGEAVNDTEFEQAASDLKQASDEAAQSGKPMTTAELLKKAKGVTSTATAKETANKWNLAPTVASKATAIKQQLKAGRISRADAEKQLKALPGFE